MNTAEGFMRTFPKWPHSLMKGINIELRLCFVTSLSVSCLKHCCIFCISELFVGKLLDLNTNLILLGKWLRSSLVWRTLLACFLLFVCQIAGLQHSTAKLEIVGTKSFLNASQRGLKQSPNKLLTVTYCLKLSLLKSSAQMPKCFEGIKHSRFIQDYIKPFSFKFLDPG